MDNANKISTGVAEIEWDERGFVRLTLLDTNNPFDLNEAKKQVDAVTQLTHGEKCKVLVDTTRAITTPTKEAEEFIASVNYRAAEALIVTALHYRILVKFYIRMHKTIPVKAFKTEQEAIAWLLSL